MDSLYIDKNSRAVQCSTLGYGKTFSVGVIQEKEVCGFVRIKNIGSDMAIFKCADYSDDGIYLSPGETEYFYIDGKTIEIIQGTLNIMY